MGSIALALLTVLSTGGFADFLYGNGEYEAASIEYLRAFHASGDTLSDAGSALRLARCHQELGRPTEALGMYLFLTERLEAGDLRASALMGAGSVYEESGMPGSAREFYMAASSEFSDTVMRDRCDVLAALALGLSSDWPGAAAELEALSSGGSALAARFLPAALEASDPPHRSPAVCAAASAVIPGFGQALCGHWTDGFTSLLMTAGTGALLAVSIDEEDTAGTVFFGWLALSFYSGGIMGAARGADMYNQRPVPGLTSLSCVQ